MSQDYAAFERLYAENPNAYRSGVRRLMWLGYGYIALCILTLVGFIVGGIWLFASGNIRVGFANEFLRMGIPAGAVAVLMLRAFFVRIPPPEGIYLEGALKERVLDFFEPIRQAAGGGPIKDVVIVTRINAAVQQRPSWGAFGPSENYLIIGAPLFFFMEADELKAVIAHEFGHLSHSHGKMGASVYRLYHTLQSAAEAIREKANSGLAEWSFKFFHWFFPKFDAMTFAMRRGQEYEADRVSAEAASPEAAAAALCRVNVIDGGWARYWQSVWRSNDSVPENDKVFPFRGLARVGPGSFFDAEEAGAALKSAFEEETTYADTHPCLRERVEALQMPKRRVGPVEETALDVIFDAEAQAMLFGLLDHEWQQNSRESWQERHQTALAEVAERSELDGRRAQLSEEELLRLAGLESAEEDRGLAKATIGQLVEKFPTFAQGQFNWGRLNFEDDFEVAENAFLACVEQDIEWVPEVTPYLRQRYEQTGEDITSSRFAPYLSRYDERVTKANAEREGVEAGESYFSAMLSDEELALLHETLARFPEVTRLELLEKQAEHFPEDRIFVLCLWVNTFHDNVEVKEDRWVDRVTPEISASLPSPNTYFYVLMNKKSPWLEAVAEVPDACVYERSISGWRKLGERLKSAYQFFVLFLIVGVLGYFAYLWLTGQL